MSYVEITGGNHSVTVLGVIIKTWINAVQLANRGVGGCGNHVGSLDGKIKEILLLVVNVALR